MTRFAPLVVLMAALSATPALAVPYDGPPQVTVETEPGPGPAAVVHAAMDVAAPPATVWAVLTACGGPQAAMPGLISCKVLRKGPGWEEREHKMKGPFFHPVVTNIFRADFEPGQRFTFHRTGGDWKRSDGEWRLTPLDGGKATHLTYVLHMAIDAPIPAGAMRDAIAKGMPQSMLTLRRAILAKAAHS